MAGIIVDLLTYSGFCDIALRDFGQAGNLANRKANFRFARLAHGD